MLPFLTFLSGLFSFYFVMLIFIRNVLGYQPRKLPMALSFLMFIPELVALYADWFWIGYALQLNNVLLMYLFLKLTYPQIKILPLLFIHRYLDCAIGMADCLFVFFFGYDHPIIQYLFDIGVMILWIILTFTPLRHKFRDVLTATPTPVMIVSLVIVSLMTSLNFIALLAPNIPECLSMYQNYMPDPSKTESALLSVVILGLFRHCVVVTVTAAFLVGLSFYLWYSASYSRMKVLNANYAQQIEIQAEHYKKLASANTEVRRFRHDFKNLRFAIEKSLADGNQTQALELMQLFGETLDTPNRQMVLFDTGNGIADALLTDKLHRAATVNSVLTFSGAIPHSTLAPTDLCVLLGNTLDNAIEACQKLPPETVRTISVDCQCSNGFLFLTIRNPIAEKVVITDHRVATTKKDATLHGLGIQSVHMVAKKYDGTVKLNADDGYFTVNIDLCLV